jgi:hypothetical protein
VFYLSVVVATYISLCTFVNFQLPREKEINVTSTLEMMNVNRVASDLSFMIIQQPAVFIRVGNVALGQYIFPLFIKSGGGVWSIPYQTLN